MKLLIAVTQQMNIGYTVEYLGRRFSGNSLEIDLVHVLKPGHLFRLRQDGDGSEDEPSRELDLCHAMLSVYAARIRALLSPRKVRTHILRGDPPGKILELARERGSDLILMGAPDREGLLSGFRLDAVTRRVLRWASCPVELIRPTSRDMLRRVLIPVSLKDGVPDTGLPELQHANWAPGTHLHLLGIRPAVVDSSRCEASAAAVLLKLQDEVDASPSLRAWFEGVCDSLRSTIPEDVKVSYELTEGPLRETITESVQRLDPDLVILDQSLCRTRRSGVFSSLDAMSLVMALPCSVSQWQDSTSGHRRPGNRIEHGLAS